MLFVKCSKYLFEQGNPPCHLIQLAHTFFLLSLYRLETVNAHGGPLPKSSAPGTARASPVNDTASTYPSSSQSQPQQMQSDDSFASEDLALHGGYTQAGSEFQSDQGKYGGMGWVGGGGNVGNV